MKIAILGGSFNPVHNGHIALAEDVLEYYDCDFVVLVPAAKNPLKEEYATILDDDRLAMLSLAVAGHPRILVDNCELLRGGVSWTYDTVLSITERYGLTEKPALVIGADIVREFHKWKNARQLSKLCDIVLADRGSRGPRFFPYRHVRIPNRIIDISSSEIRRRVNEETVWAHLVPCSVVRYIQEKGLYNNKSSTSIDTYSIMLEARAFRTLSSQRYLHSRSVAVLAASMARRFGMDEKKAFLAGIAHDLCKEMPEQDILSLAQEDGQGLEKFEKKKPALLHARAAAVLLRKEYQIHDEEVLHAVAYHTYGAVGMCKLAKLVYIADKIEFLRPDVDPLLRDLVWESDIDSLFARTLRDTGSWLRSKGRQVAKNTQDALDTLDKGLTI